MPDAARDRVAVSVCGGYLGSIEEVESVLCAKCGAQAPDENKFCGNCGNPIDRAAVGSLTVKGTGAAEEK
jgi:predicted amidophosphoribosyltransferase